MIMSALIKELKSEDQDYEFYPTTDEILSVLLNDVESRFPYMRADNRTFVDIGAGHGKVLDAVHKQLEGTWHTRAVERSEVLINELVKHHMVIGTEFNELNLSTYLGDAVYCNPPYSQFEQWATDLIRHMPTKFLYLLIPIRWVNNKDIDEALAFSESTCECLGNFSFQDAEDRKARAQVQLVRITSKLNNDELLDKFLAERYPGFDKAEEYDKETEYQKEQRRSSEIHKLTVHMGRVSALVEAYNGELEKLIAHSDKIYSLDPSLLLSLGVSLYTIRTTLTQKINGLRDLYWDELFTSLDAVRRRFTAKNLDAFSNRIKKMRSIDFTAKNIYAVVCYVLEQANHYTESQTLDVFDTLTMQASVTAYVSNRKVFGENGNETNWRHRRKPDGLTHYKLDYRIILCTWNRGLERADFGGGISLSHGGADQIADILTVLRALHYDVDPNDPRLCERYVKESQYWGLRQSQEFCDAEGTTIVEVKAMLNGNMHLRFAPRAILDLNVAVGRYRGWLNSPEEAVRELDDPDAAESFHRASAALITMSALPLGLAAPACST